MTWLSPLLSSTMASILCMEGLNISGSVRNEHWLRNKQQQYRKQCTSVVFWEFLFFSGPLLRYSWHFRCAVYQWQCGERFSGFVGFYFATVSKSQRFSQPAKYSCCFLRWAKSIAPKNRYVSYLTTNCKCCCNKNETRQISQPATQTFKAVCRSFFENVGCDDENTAFARCIIDSFITNWGTPQTYLLSSKENSQPDDCFFAQSITFYNRENTTFLTRNSVSEVLQGSFLSYTIWSEPSTGHLK